MPFAPGGAGGPAVIWALPDCTITARNGGLFGLLVKRWKSTDLAPALSPKIVTL
jgi:hypothetical protein